MGISPEAGRVEEFPRPLTALECEVIQAILIDGIPGVVELRSQLKSARVSARWQPSGSPSIDLEIPADLTAAHVTEGPFPVDAHVYDPDENYIGELLLWLSEGRLSSLEFAWVTEEMPLSLPSENWIKVNRR